MNEITTTENIKIEGMIFEIRGKQVILASDVAKLYKVETKRINEVVKRNVDRFPEDFCFKLSKVEIKELCSRSQFATLNNETKGRGYNVKYLPYVFTEHGVMMLSGLLKSEIAARVNVSIINAFVKMKKYISNELIEQRYINKMVYNLDARVSLLENTFSKFDTFSNELFFDGQIYDAHSLLLDIFNSSKKNIVIIDNYISKELLDVVCKINKNITIYTKNMDNTLITKYKKQYNNIAINITDTFHDRFIIIDDNMLYHCGASFKDLGKKCFAINKINSTDILNELKNKLMT